MATEPPRPRAPSRRLWRWLRRASFAALGFVALFFLVFHAAVAFWPYPSGVERMPRDSTLLCDARGLPVAEFAAPDGQWRTTLAESQISPHLLSAIVAVEDARFFEHHGVDWKAVAAAAWQDLSALRARRGGSTITMQLHRLRQPLSHGLWGKFEQAVRAAQIERTQDKRHLLVEYLNRAPFGGNLVGAGAASWRYFGRPCTELSLAQAALLAGLPKNPTADRPDRFPQRARARRDFVLGRMLALGRIGPAALQPLMPTLTYLARQSPGGRSLTTLDRPTQQLVSTAAREHLEQQGDHITEIAVVVVDTASARGLASVSLSRSGAAADLDLTRRPRSTGSVIKPLIYAAAFDAGASAPHALLDDSPAAWPGYAPANYDLQFRGRMTAAQALAESRNIPALRLLSEVGVARAAGVCGAMGLRTLSRTPHRYGLSLAIGGAEATPSEIAEAYATLARGGRHRPITWQMPAGAGDLDDRTASATLSPHACRETLDCLNDPRRTAALCPEAAPLNIAWKTGTSSGHRDAWCAAVGPARVVVVWMGNAAGQGAGSLIGSEAAAPLALRLLAAIDARIPAQPPAPASSTPPPHPRALQATLTIVAPSDRAQIVADPDTPPAQQRVQLRARTSVPSDPPAPLFWFVDGSPIGTASADQPLWWPPTPGDHEIRAVDPTGHADRVRIRVVQ